MILHQASFLHPFVVEHFEFIHRTQVVPTFRLLHKHNLLVVASLHYLV